MGYPAFKIHMWQDSNIDRQIATVEAVGKRVGDKMDLMLDPGCIYDTFADAWKVGRALDDWGTTGTRTHLETEACLPSHTAG